MAESEMDFDTGLARGWGVLGTVPVVVECERKCGNELREGILCRLKPMTGTKLKKLLDMI